MLEDKNMKIWVYWEQGWNCAPYVVNCCRESLIEYASDDFEIVFLDAQNISSYIQNKLPTVFSLPNFPIQIKSDWIRLNLLRENSGIWIDSTIFLNDKLKKLIDQISSDFFAFFRYPAQLISSWFLVSRNDNYIINKFTECFNSKINLEFYTKNQIYFDKWRGSPNYFLLHTTFHELCKNDERFREEVQQIDFRSSSNILYPSVCYGYNNKITNEIYALIANNHPMFKLSHSLKQEDKKEGSTIDLLIKKMKKLQYEEAPEHFHTSRSIKPTKIWNSDLNVPSRLGFVGIVSSESDLKISKNISNKGYHVANFRSIDNAHAAQLLVPYDKSELYIRSSKNNRFCEPVKVLTENSAKQLLAAQQNIAYWNNVLSSTPRLPGIRASTIFSKDYFQFFFEPDIPTSIHIEFHKNCKNSVFFHVEDEYLTKQHESILRKIALNINVTLQITPSGYASFEVKSEKRQTAFEQVYLATISIVRLLFKPNQKA